jgi:hypothetical protein
MALIATALDAGENPDVRYGAVRSAVELAALHSADGGASILKRLTDSLHVFFPTTGLGEADKRLSNVRLELRRCCALNEPAIPNRAARMLLWKDCGLAQYDRLLEEGEKLASDSEKHRWSSWRDAVNRVRATEDGEQDWSVRLKIWREAIKAETQTSAAIIRSDRRL